MQMAPQPVARLHGAPLLILGGRGRGPGEKAGCWGAPRTSDCQVKPSSPTAPTTQACFCPVPPPNPCPFN